MNLPDPRNPAFRRRVLGMLAILLVACLAAHPEARLLLPMLDATGIDVLVTLLGLQALVFFSDRLKPWLLLAWQRIARALHLAGHATWSMQWMRRACRFAGAPFCSGPAGIAVRIVAQRASLAISMAAFQGQARAASDASAR
jgi:hypothetical protein